MCGIAGEIAAGRADLAASREMAQLLRHRGPDDEGFVAIVDGVAFPLSGPDTTAQALGGRFPFSPREAEPPGAPDVVLANRRLAIVDLSPAGHQPLCTPDRRIWVTHNGEIYNHVELRSELEAHGHSFAGHSDTEVVAAAYAQWGTACFARFNGMWATAIWDSARATVVLSRDRFGVKPLYYARRDGRVSFASEIKALVRAGVAGTEQNTAVLRRFLQTGRIDLVPGATSFAHVSQLEPGTYAEVGLDGSMKFTRYYSLARPSEASRSEGIRDLLADAVRLRLRSDVPVGSCLSGGLDSSSIVALAAREGNTDFQTFTFAAVDPRHDEREAALRVARHAGATAHVVTLPEEGLPELLERAVDEQEEPIGSGSVLAQRAVMELAHAEGMKVLLDGQGGDEAFAGYPYYAAARLANQLRALRFRAWARGVSAAADNTLQSAAWLRRASLGELRRGADRVRSLQLADVAEHLPALLHYEDRNSMAFSIETRLPFLDFRVVELGLALTDDAKLGDGWTKLAVRRAVADLLPEETVWRRDKVQFSAPQDRWLDGPLRDYARDVLADRADDELADAAPSGPDGTWRRLSVKLWRRAYAVT